MTTTKEKESRRKKRHRRIRATVSGTADRPRLSVYRSNNHIYAQIINDEAGETLAAASSLSLDFEGSLNEAAEAVGEAIAEEAKTAGIEKVVFDRGGYDYAGCIETLADSARDNGLDF